MDDSPTGSERPAWTARWPESLLGCALGGNEYVMACGKLSRMAGIGNREWGNRSSNGKSAALHTCLAPLLRFSIPHSRFPTKTHRLTERQRLADQIALRVFAAEFAEGLQLSLGLDTFGDNVAAQ